MGLMTTQACCLALGVLCTMLLPASCQGPSGKPTMVLVHGQDVGGASFAYPQPELDAPTGVVGLLEDAGYAVFNPSLPYHDSPSDAYNKSDGAVTADDYAQSLASVFIANDITNATAVCHASGGAWCQILFALVPGRIARFVYINAFVVLPGSSIYTTDAQLFAYNPAAVSAAVDQAALSNPVTRKINIIEWGGHLIQTRASDAAFVQATFNALVVPEPAAPLAEKLNTTAFATAPVPKAFVFQTEDFLYGFKQPDLAPFLLFAERLRALPNGGVPFKLFNLTTDHIGYLTRPAESAQVILEAVAYLGG